MDEQQLMEEGLYNVYAGARTEMPGCSLCMGNLAPEIYRYLNFGKMDEYVESAKRGQEIAIKLVV
jgi:aconitase B